MAAVTNASLLYQISFDPSTLFPGNDFPAEGELMDLSGLATALAPPAGGEEYFFPCQLFVRAEMRQVFEELRDDASETKILSGSPGVGKSILLFLTAIFRVWTETDRKITYLRYTKHLTEPASAFAMQRDETDPKKTKVHIRFNRQIVKHGGASLVLNSVRNSLSQPEWNVFHKSNLTMVDGPLARQATEFSPLAALCTSGGGSRVTSELRATAKGQETKKIGTTNIVLSAWTKEQQKDALIACLHLREGDSTESDEQAKEPDSHETGGAARGVSLDGEGAPMVLDYHQEVFDEDSFDEVYFCTGGRIRDMVALYTNPSSLDDFKSDIATDIDRITKSQAKVALARADEKSTSVHVDSVRSLYRREKTGEKKKYSKDAVDIFVDSQYIMRQLYQKIDGDE